MARVRLLLFFLVIGSLFVGAGIPRTHPDFGAREENPAPPRQPRLPSADELRTRFFWPPRGAADR